MYNEHYAGTGHANVAGIIFAHCMNRQFGESNWLSSELALKTPACGDAYSV